jgi:hypothetical protein
MMALPKGTFKGLARVVAPLWLWMAAGWFAYPYMILKIVGDAGESMNEAEVWLFSKIMVPTCIILGIALAVYGFTGKDAEDSEIKALANPEPLCPYCGTQLANGTGQCPTCRKDIPKV